VLLIIALLLILAGVLLLVRPTLAEAVGWALILFAVILLIFGFVDSGDLNIKTD
jgi:hypothetical protein